MATLTVWRFDDPHAATRAVDTLMDLRRRELIRVHDAATVSWPVDERKPRTTQLHDTVGPAALGGSFWGFLFGLLFLVPMLGAAIGAATGALAGALTDVGIDDSFIGDVRAEIVPGTSALFVLSSDAVVDRVSEAFADARPHSLHTNLSTEQEDRLRDAFAVEA